jgi:hypothetical protein
MVECFVEALDAGRLARCVGVGTTVASQQKIVFFPKRLQWKIRIYFASSTLVSFSREVHMKILVAAAMLSALAISPASAAMMKCTSDNMMKSTSMMMTMPESSGKTAANKEIGMANTAMSQGKMGAACGHYMKAQKAAMMK